MKKNDSMGKVNKILSSIDDDTLQKGIDKLKGMSDSESAKLKKQLDGIDKQKVLDMFNTLSPEKIKQKLSDFDINRLDALKGSTQIIDRLKKDNKR